MQLLGSFYVRGGGVNLSLLHELITAEIHSIFKNAAFSAIPKEKLETYTISYKLRNKILTTDEAVRFLDNVRIHFDPKSKG